MFLFRLVLGLLLLVSVLCFAMFIGTGQPVWRQRGLVVLKWTLLAAAGNSSCARTAPAPRPGISDHGSGSGLSPRRSGRIISAIRAGRAAGQSNP